MSRIIVALLVSLVLVSIVVPAAYADQPVEPRHPNNGQDPCTGNCGNGDHGMGDPTNGSEHASINAAQGEVDPVADEPAGDEPASDTSADVPADEPVEPAGDEPVDPASDPVVDPAGDVPADAPAADPVVETVETTIESDDCITETVVMTETGVCNLCEDLATIKAQHTEILANQGKIIALLEKILEVLLSLMSA